MSEGSDLEPWEVAWLAADAWFTTHGWFSPEEAWTEDSDDAPAYLKDFFRQVAAVVLAAHGGKRGPEA